MAQPPLSQGLQRLETELGIRLLNRDPRGLTLTDAGAALLPHAHTLLQAEQDLRETAQAQGSGDARVRLGVDPRLPIGLSAVLAEVCSAATSVVRITVHTAPTNSVLEAVAVGRFQLGVVVHPAVLGVVDGGPVIRLPTGVSGGRAEYVNYLAPGILLAE